MDYEKLWKDLKKSVENHYKITDNISNEYYKGKNAAFFVILKEMECFENE